MTLIPRLGLGNIPQGPEGFPGETHGAKRRVLNLNVGIDIPIQVKLLGKSNCVSFRLLRVTARASAPAGITEKTYIHKKKKHFVRHCFNPSREILGSSPFSKEPGC